MKNDLWVIEWQDIGGDANQALKIVARSPEEAVERIRSILGDEHFWDEEFDSSGRVVSAAEVLAFDALFAGEDPVAAIRDLNEEIQQQSDGGTIIITPCWA
jgi:hypothetical protein